MIIPSQHASRVARAAGGGGGDNTPNAVNWADVTTSAGSKPVGYRYAYSAQQITGVDTSITLRTVFTTTSYVGLYYKVQSTSTVPASTSAPTSNGYTNILHNGTITVSNNEYVVFSTVGAGSNTNSVITVNNTSDSNATLDTFTATSTLV
jgi:hypothetical protein